MKEYKHTVSCPHAITKTKLTLYFHAVICSFFSLPNLSGQRLDVYHNFHTWCGPSVNLECRSEMWCTRLAENTGRKKVGKNRHLGTIPQLFRAISSQLRHVSTIGKKILLSSNISSRCPTSCTNPTKPYPNRNSKMTKLICLR